MIRRIIGLIILGVVLSGGIATAGDAGKETAAVSAAEKWLATIDAGQYAASWKETAEFFRNAVKPEQWEQSMNAVRKPLGKLVSRKVQTKAYKTSLPGAPDGEYVVIQFETVFENSRVEISIDTTSCVSSGILNRDICKIIRDKKSSETVTPMMDKDGKWRVSGYYVK